MDRLLVGDTEVIRVQELSCPVHRPQELFPGMTEDMLAEARRILGEASFAADLRLMLSFHSFVVRTARYTILVDTCCGNDKLRPTRDAFSNLGTGYLDRLREAGIAPESVDYVLCTHLHWDHVGWNTRLVDGQWVPTFPNAKYLVSRVEYEFWKLATDRADGGLSGTSFADSVAPIERAGKLMVVESDHAVDDGLWLEPCHGHTAGHVVLNVQCRGTAALLIGDVMHHQVQLLYPELSTYADHDQDLSRRTRTALIERLADSATIAMPAHFPAPSMGLIRSAQFGYRFDACRLR